jgi:alcohol dehydrogenase class IV
MPAGEPPPAVAARFEFATAGRVIFGAGVWRDLPAVAADYGRRVLLVTGSRSDRHAELIAAIRSAVDAVEIFTVPSEPTVDLAEAGAHQARTLGCEAVIAIGGGSAIDAGKAIVALATAPGPALDYLEVVGHGKPLPRPSLPFIAVPTTAGTGAEVTRNAVLSVPAARVKVSLRSVHMLPRVALVDPELARDLPAATTAATGMDALTQLIEPFLSCRANPFIDALCRDGIARIARALPRAMEQPHDLAARADLALGALYSGMALANAGLGAVHGFAAPIGGQFPAPHGAVCAALLPHVLAANLHALRLRAPGHPSLAKFDELGRLLTGRPHATAVEAVDFCASLVEALAIPRLGHWGITRAAADELAAKAAAASSMKANPIPLTHAELVGILVSALGSAA